MSFIELSSLSLFFFPWTAYPSKPFVTSPCSHELLPFLCTIHPSECQCSSGSRASALPRLGFGEDGTSMPLAASHGNKMGRREMIMAVLKVHEDVGCICVGRGGGYGHFCESVPRKTGQGPLSSPRSSWRCEALPRVSLSL